MPEKILDEISNMNELTTLRGDSAFILLRQMVSSKIITNEQLYEKLWDRVLQTHQKIYNKRCASLIKVITEYQELYPQKSEENTMRMQTFIDKYVQILKSSEMETQDNVVAPEIYFCMTSIKRFQEITRESSLTDSSLDASKFMESCSSIIMKSSQTMNPSRLMAVLQTFSEVPT